MTNLLVNGPMNGLVIAWTIGFDANIIPTSALSPVSSLCLSASSSEIGFIVGNCVVVGGSAVVTLSSFLCQFIYKTNYK
jgi:hypothetical protein